MKKTLVSVILLLLTAHFTWAQNKGQVFETRSLQSKILNMERKYSIYLPPDYENSDQNYPVLYLLHGSGDDHTAWVQFGQVQRIADKAIAEGTACSMIIVMPDANTGTRGYFNALGGKFNYEDFFFKELLPHIEKEYRVRSERQYRAISGLSMGGGGTIYYAMHHPELFAAAAPLSASTGNWDLTDFLKNTKERQSDIPEKEAETFFHSHSLPSLIQNATEKQLNNIKSIRWYISCGDDDFLYEGNSQMHILFRKNQIPHEYRVKDGGHTWPYWRMELPFVLEFVSKSFTR